MLETKIFYKLILKGKTTFLSFEKESNEGKYACGEHTYTLSDSPYSESNDFETENKETALEIANTKKSIAWYNSSKDEPVIPDNFIGKIEVVEVKSTFTKIVQ